MSLTKTHKALFALLKAGLCPDGSEQVGVGLSGSEWCELFDLSECEGVSAICVDGFNVVRPQMPADGALEYRKLQWFGGVMQQEQQFAHMWEVAKKLDALWSAEDIHAVVLKGRSVAQYYPKPEHRYSCDIDVWIGEDWERACAILEREGIELCHEVYKEVEFTVDGVYVECHRYITPVRGNKNLLRFEKYLRSLLEAEGVGSLELRGESLELRGESLELRGERVFEGTNLVNPPLMFTVMLYIEHALGDLLQGKLTLKHVVDWCVLRREFRGESFFQSNGVLCESVASAERELRVFESRCKEFGFEKCLRLVDAMADVVEGKVEYDALPSAYRKVMDEIMNPVVPDAGKQKKPKTWFERRVDVFFSIVKNGRKYKEFGYDSMPRHLFNSMWTHFFRKEVRF